MPAGVMTRTKPLIASSARPDDVPFARAHDDSLPQKTMVDHANQTQRLHVDPKRSCDAGNTRDSHPGGRRPKLDTPAGAGHHCEIILNDRAWRGFGRRHQL
jgi:hypothetical protein